MGMQSPVVLPEEGMIAAYSAVYVPPSSEYVTSMVHFPATNATGVWSSEGVFYASMEFYKDSKQYAKINTQWQNQNGIVKILTDDIFAIQPDNQGTLAILKYSHPRTIPVAGYLSVVHRKTGTYAPLPVLQYMGDEIFPDFHDTVLETAMFWPGVMSDEKTTQTIVVLNPYKTSFLYQMHLFISDTEKVSTSVTKIPPLAIREHEIDKEFSDHLSAIRAGGGKCSVCITAQYKVLPIMVMRDRKNNIISGIDHLHPYALF